MKKHFKKFAKGFAFLYFVKIINILLATIKFFTIAKILDPTQVGLYSILLVILGTSEAITQTGVNYTILHSKKNIRYFLDTALIISIIRGFTISIIMLFVGLVINHFSDIKFLSLLFLTILIPFIKGFINPATALFDKNLEFKNLSFYKISISFIDTISSIVFLIFLKSTKALILANIFSALFEVLLSFFIYKKYTPKFKYSSKVAKAILKNTKWISLASFLSYINENFDDLIVKFLYSTSSLGIYHNAYAIGHKPNLDITKTATDASVPVLSKLKNNDKQFKQVSKNIEKTIFFIIIPLSLTVLLLIRPITIFLGKKWSRVEPLIFPFILAGIVGSLIRIKYANIMAKDNNQNLINIHLFLNSLLMIAFYMFLGYLKKDLVYIAYSLVFARLLSFFIVFYVYKNE